MSARAIVLAAGLVALCAAVPVKFQPEATTHPKAAPSAGAMGFDYLHLVQEWPGSFCDTKKGCYWPKVQPVKGWLLHGLWPEFNNGSWPEYCDKDYPFNMSAIEDMLAELQDFWPSLVNADESAFWAHEWTRHGTCAEKLTPKEHDYFRLVLTLREQFDVYKILRGSGIVPNSTTTWKAVKQSLDSIGGAVEVGCNMDAMGRMQLYEVRSCYVPTAVQGMSVVQVDCRNGALASSCGGPDNPIMLPPYSKTPSSS